MANAAFRHKVVDAALAVFVTGVPILDRGVLDFRFVQRHQFDHCRVQLVFVALGRRAPFEVADIAAFVRHHQRALKLARAGFVDAEVGAQLHRASHALGDVTE